MTTNERTTGTRQLTGSCHCGSVRFEVEMDLADGMVTRCNCSICLRLGITGKIVKPSAFRLLSGAEKLSEYRWGSKVAARYFCRTCGVHCHGAGHLDVLGGDFVSINLNTVDGIDPWTLPVVYWDGRHDNWQAGPRPTPWPLDASA